MKCSVPLPRNGFVNTPHKCQQLMIYVVATARCAHHCVGSDIAWLKNVAFRFQFFRLSSRSMCLVVFLIIPGLFLIRRTTCSITFPSDITGHQRKDVSLQSRHCLTEVSGMCFCSCLPCVCLPGLSCRHYQFWSGCGLWPSHAPLPPAVWRTSFLCVCVF